MKPPTFKIYFHEKFYHQAPLPLRQKGSWLKRFLRFFTYGIWGVCLLCGEWLLAGASALLKFIKNEISFTLLNFKKRSRLFFSRAFLRNHAVMVLCGLGVIFAIAGVQLFAQGIELKERVYDFFKQGQGNLEQAKSQLMEKNVPGAGQNFLLALKNFRSAQDQVTQSDQRLKIILNVLPQGQDGQKILRSSAQLAESANAFLDFYNQLQNVKVTAEGISAAAGNQEKLQAANAALQSASTNLQAANVLLEQVNEASVPQNQRAEFISLRGQIRQASATAQNFGNIFNLFVLVLQKSQNVLLIMENNNELRPGGGFIGSFAAISQQNGTIAKMRLGSIYDLDGQLHEQIQPPLPLLTVNERWFLRDSNWFADWRQNARKITEFYEKEGGQTPDLIISLTPTVMQDLLKITGPVQMPAYKTTLTSENFVEQTQVLTTMSEDQPENQPKQFLADLMPVFLQRLGTLDFNQLDDVLGVLYTNLNSKQILFNSRYGEIESQLEEFNWAGQILSSDRDYLNIVSSNLGATKSDLYIDQTADLKTTIDASGEVTNELTLTFTNRLPELDYTVNTRFVRVLVPKDSKLISITGFDYKNLEPPQNTKLKQDSDASVWDSQTLKDIVTGTLIGQEAGKTYFGNWLTVKGGQTRSVKFVYQLPFTLKSLDHFSLLMQKQPGAMFYNFTYLIDMGNRKVAWKNFDNDTKDSLNMVYTNKFNTDTLLGMVLQK